MARSSQPKKPSGVGGAGASGRGSPRAGAKARDAKTAAGARARVSVGLGTLEVTEGWGRVGEAALVKEPPKSAAPLALNRAIAPPRIQLSVSALPPGAAEGADVLAALLESLQRRVRQVQLLARGPFSFDDGAAGEHLIVTFEAVPGLSATQVHVIRKVSENTVHILASIPPSAPKDAVAEVTAFVRSFQPAGT